MTPRKDDAASLSGAYVLNALDQAEKARFESHLEESEESRHELTELTDTAVLLGMAVDPETPPPSLKASIMAQLDSTPQLPRLTETKLPDVAEFSGPAAAKAQQRWFTRPANMLIAAAAAVLLVVGAGAVGSSLLSNTEQQQAADQLAAINAADDSQRAAAEVVGGGTATLVWSEELASAAVMVDDFEPLPSSKVYELWYIDSDGARPAGTFSVGDSGSTWRVLDGEMAEGDTVGVTIEPAGGSKQPTTDPIVAITSA